jgi:hypothetical protein
METTPDKTAAAILPAYLETALWASTDENGNPLDSRFTVDDFAPAALDKARRDCAAFAAANREDIDGGPVRCGPDYSTEERAGHDFFLTRNDHGAGFWDGDWPEEAGERLTASAHSFGGADVYPGDDGLLYFFPD